MADLPNDVTLYFRVVARDHLGWESMPSSAVSTTIDTTGPSAALADELSAFTQGNMVTVNWTSAEDPGIGGVMHRLVVYESEALAIPVHVPEWTPATEHTVRGLFDGVTYWFVVESMDDFGNLGEASTSVSTTMDATAPELLMDSPGFFGGTGGHVTGTVTDAGSGVDSVEFSVDGEAWSVADLDEGEWTVAIADLPQGTTGIHLRATDAVGNVLVDRVIAPIDILEPVVRIDLPTGDETVSGVVPIIGMVEDEYLSGYVVEVKRSDASTWMTVQPMQSTEGVAGTLASWVTAGSTAGDYTIRVTATDVFGQSSSAEVTVLLKGAHLTIGTGDITFSDSHPLPGDTITVFVTVRNDGDSPAENVAVTLYDKGKPVGSETVTVPAHGTSVVPVKAKVEGSHEFTAQATSPYYDTGTMTMGQPLQTIEEEAMLENAGGVLGLIALILVLILMLLYFLERRKGGGEVVEAEPEPDETEVILDQLLEEDGGFEEQPVE
jgi:hypothetical protein